MHPSSAGYDIAIIGACLLASLAIGLHFSRRQTGASSYFLGENKLPGWLVGFSITSSMISAMTFLAIPGFSYQQDYRWVLPSFSFFLMALFAMKVLAPFFRTVTAPSGYAFLEERFGGWARTYAAASFLLFKLLRLGVVLYVTCLALEVFLGVSAPLLMVIVGVVATLYTMMGGFEAVIWTEFFQALVLIAGALIIVPVALHLIPGGAGAIFRLARPAGKMALGDAHFALAGKTVWVMIASSLFYNASDYATRQDFIQRYRSPRSLGHARLALLIAALTVVPIWLYFNFLGTALWTYYRIYPDAAASAAFAREPEKVVPYFMASHLPPGLNGLVLAAICMASLSAIAGILNASAVTWVSDFHQRFFVREGAGRQTLRLARWTTVTAGAMMIGLALWIHALRSSTLQDLQATGQMIFSAGLFGLFMIGFFSNRVGRRAALQASVATLVLVAVWLGLGSAWGQRICPGAAAWTPDAFWIPVFSNLFLPAAALLLAHLSAPEKVPPRALFFRSQAEGKARPMRALLLCAGLLAASGSGAAEPAWVFVAGDQTSGYRTGSMYVRPGARPGVLTAIDFSTFPPRSWHEEGVPCSVIGPPTCVAATASGGVIVVAGAMRADPAHPDRLVVDRQFTWLSWSPAGLRKIAQREIGGQPSGVTLSADGRRAYVTLRAEGRLVILALEHGTIRTIGSGRIARPEDSLSHFALLPGSSEGLATLHDKGTVRVIALEGNTLRVAQELRTGPSPYDLKLFADGRRAVVADSGADNVSILERANGRWAATQRIPVGHGPEGVAISPDENWIAVSCFNGANSPGPKDRWFGKPSQIQLLARDSSGRWAVRQLVEVDSMPQSAVFSPDGRYLVAGEYGLGDLRVFRPRDQRWEDTGLHLEVPGQPAALAAGGR